MTNNNGRIYLANIKRLALIVLPTWLRRPTVAALLFAGVEPLGRILLELRNLREETGYRTGHNGQVCRLQAAVNDIFDQAERRIRIVEIGDAEGNSPTVLWMRETGRWVMVGERGGKATIIGGRGLAGSGGYDFAVELPVGLDVDESRLRAVVNIYKLASKRFAIIYRDNKNI